MTKPLSLSHYWLRDLIREHAQGKQQAMPLPEVARRMGTTTRKVQTLKQELLDVAGVVICSSTANPPGLFWPTSSEEIAPFRAQLASRAKSNLRAVASIDRKYPQLRAQSLRTPPLTVTPHGPAVVAQMAFDALEVA